MRRLLLLIAAIAFQACIADAGEPSGRPVPNQRSTAVPVVETTVNACRFRYKDLYAGYLPDRPSSYRGHDPYNVSGSLDLSFQCLKFDDQSAFARQHNGRYDSLTGHWIGDTTALSPDDVDYFHQYTRVADIKTVNASGFYRVDDDTNGDESKRERTFIAYIFHDHVALQAIGRAGTLNEPKKSLVPHMLRVLKTVEFIEP